MIEIPKHTGEYRMLEVLRKTLSKDTTREALQYLKVETDENNNSRFIACDGHMIMIHKSVLKLDEGLYKLQKVSNVFQLIKLENKEGLAYPEYNRLFFNPKEYNHHTFNYDISEGKPHQISNLLFLFAKLDVCINYSFLERLIGLGDIKFFVKEKQPVSSIYFDSGECTGIVMSLRTLVDDDTFEYHKSEVVEEKE